MTMRLPHKMAVALGIAALHGSVATATPPPGRLTPATIFDWRTVADPQVSPDGAHVVYVYGWSDVMTDTSRSNLWIVSADGQDPRPITAGGERDSSPRWSPDGTRLAYLSQRDGKTNIYLWWMDTGQTAKITNLTEAPGNLAWSPDGRHIAFTKLVAPSASPRTVQLPPRPPGARWAAPPIVIDKPMYRYDGRGYLPPGFTQIFITPVTGGVPRQLTFEELNHGAPAWMPDGRTLLFSAARGRAADRALGDTEIFKIAVDNGSVEPITGRRGPDNDPTPSPDGRWIAYSGFDERDEGYTVSRLYVMKPDGARSQPLSGAWDRDVADLRWAPDSSGVYATSGDRGNVNVYFFPLDGEMRQVTSGAQRVSDLAVGGHRAAVVLTRPQDPPDVYTFGLDGHELRRLTNVNATLLAGVRLGDVEEIWYKSFDGLDVQGWIVKPPDFDPSKKYPLLLYIHGGPYMMYDVGFHHEFQVHAAHGYVVLYTNPRGSTGYGQPFANSIFDDYPGDNFYDLMKGVDAVVAKGYIDEQRLAVTGGSGGGLLTAWVVGHTHRFAVAAAQYPTIDWYSMVLTTDNGYGLGRRRFRKWPWEDPEKYYRHSPVNYAGNITTPVLIITGEADWRTPISQSEEFYGALKLQDKEAVLVRVPDEPHGIGVHPSHRLAKVLYLIDWFDRHLGAAQAGPVQ